MFLGTSGLEMGGEILCKRANGLWSDSILMRKNAKKGAVALLVCSYNNVPCLPHPPLLCCRDRGVLGRKTPRVLSSFYFKMYHCSPRLLLMLLGYIVFGAEASPTYLLARRTRKRASRAGIFFPHVELFRRSGLAGGDRRYQYSKFPELRSAEVCSGSLQSQ